MITLHSNPSHLILIGGGHSHAIFLKLWSQFPLDNVKISLISNVTNTPYSGMLPGYIAGLYNYQDIHINLQKLCQLAKVNFILDEVVGLDLTNNQVLLNKNLPISFDYLSINIGSTPFIDYNSLQGELSRIIPVKPIPIFLKSWYHLLENCQSQQPINITLVGGGVGGVELAFNMLSRLQKLNYTCQINLIQRDKTLIPSHNKQVQKIVTNLLQKRQITTYLQENITTITSHAVICQSGLEIKSDYCFWVTQAKGSQWLQNSDLFTDKQGFISVNHHLQSLSHPYIFAGGDIATIQGENYPKAGVFAVRQGKPLFTNIKRFILGEDLLEYIPQKQYLALIGTGDYKAILSRGDWGFYSPLLWRWKNWLDRTFMLQFN